MLEIMNGRRNVNILREAFGFNLFRGCDRFKPPILHSIYAEQQFFVHQTHNSEPIRGKSLFFHSFALAAILKSSTSVIIYYYISPGPKEKGLLHKEPRTRGGARLLKSAMYKFYNYF